jgi:colanic acid/amylovoran biosynthesis protein
MNIFVINAHSDNRGDEAAIKAMTDELLRLYPTAEITISRQGGADYPCMDKRVKQIKRFPVNGSKIDQLSFFVSIFTKGKLAITKDGKEFLNTVRKADIVLHAPGGPSIGDIYGQVEWLYLLRLDLIRRMNKRYMFYAPSMGPFHNKRNNRLRKKVILSAEKIILRDPISIEYLKQFMPEVKVEHAMDSALQHDITETRLETTYNDSNEIKEFLENHKRVIGLTITDLRWHPVYGKSNVATQIEQTFKCFIKEKVDAGYGIIFVPQLYGEGNDYELMKKYMLEKNTYILAADRDEYDTYFQQYLIGKLYAVIGMRYHSNIFSAKMGTPFVSVSYEQKMQGFMESVELSDYCLPVHELSYEHLNDKFAMLENNYERYRDKLRTIHDYMREKSYYTTQVVKDLLENK